jgi:hypothetical protein
VSGAEADDLSKARAILARAERVPFDERRGDLDALAIAERLRDAGAPALRLLRANALRLAGRDHDEQARRAFEELLAHAPNDGNAWFDAGLFHKVRGRWSEALDAAERARALLGDEKRVLWNLAIAATALGRGEVAAGAWRSLGLPVTINAAGLAVVGGLDAVEVRVPSRGSGHAGAPVADTALSFEVVRVAPLSPCHGVVETPTLRDAPIDYGDVVLWDGAPVSVSDAGGRPLPRFALLEILRRGDESRLRFVALEQRAGQVAALEQALPEGARVFTLEARVEAVCSRCAAGEVLRPHAHERPEDHRMVRGKIIVPRSVALARVALALERALGAEPGVALAVPGLYEALGDAGRAGREHQAYRGIERVHDGQVLAT